MTETADTLSIRACRPEDIERVLELWRQADATPGVTHTADDLRRAIAESPAHVLVAEVAGLPDHADVDRFYQALRDHWTSEASQGAES